MAAENCCSCVKLERGCLLLGVVTFVLSACITVAAITTIAMEDQRAAKTSVLMEVANATAPHHVLGLSWPKPIIDITLGIVLVMCILWMLFSTVLVVGILKNNAACVMSYFLFGSGVSLTLLVTAVLELIKKMWPFSLVTVICTALYIRCLVVVYSAYDRLQQGKTFGDRDHLIVDEEFEVDSD